MDKEIPLLSSLFPNLDLTDFGKTYNINKPERHLTKNSKITSNEITNIFIDYFDNIWKIAQE